MTRGIEDRQNELKKVAKSMEDRQAQLEKAAKEIKDKRIKRIEKEIELTTSIPEDKITDNFAEELVQQGHVKEEEERIPGLKVMGVFIGCRILMTLGWGGVTSALVSMFKASSGRGAVQCGDAPTSTSGVASGEKQIPLKAAVMSFRDGRKKMEWPKR